MCVCVCLCDHMSDPLGTRKSNKQNIVKYNLFICILRTYLLFQYLQKSHTEIYIHLNNDTATGTLQLYLVLPLFSINYQSFKFINI